MRRRKFREMTSKRHLHSPTLSLQLFIHLITRHWDLAEKKAEETNGLLALPFVMGKRGRDRY